MTSDWFGQSGESAASIDPRKGLCAVVKQGQAAPLRERTFGMLPLTVKKEASSGVAVPVLRVPLSGLTKWGTIATCVRFEELAPGVRERSTGHQNSREEGRGAFEAPARGLTCCRVDRRPADRSIGVPNRPQVLRHRSLGRLFPGLRSEPRQPEGKRRRTGLVASQAGQGR